MTMITEQMVRSRAEHNECEITTLEELSLHQQDIEKIDHLERWCKHLRILYLQSNLISKIENVGRLKELEYLNLALNNITKIQNLQKCESLQKLDLTVNFVHDLLSIKSLTSNIHLRELFLTGNPCTDYTGYREYVIATLTQLVWLDGKEILRSDRIQALQQLPQLEESIREQQEKYIKDKEGNTGIDDEDTVPYTPEARTALHREISEKRQEGKERNTTKKERKPERKLERDGRMLNINEGRYEFTLNENEDSQCYIVDVACPRFMDTSLIDCDIQPTYIRISIKGKLLQLVLPEEVSPDSSNALRSQTTGHLVITMPKANPRTIKHKPKQVSSTTTPKTSATASKQELKEEKYLEVPDNSCRNILDIVKETETNNTVSMNDHSNDFIDDDDVPPLI